MNHYEEENSITEVLETTGEAHMQGLIKQVVVIGLDHDGGINLGFSMSDPLRVMGLLEAAKQELLLDMMEFEDDEE